MLKGYFNVGSAFYARHFWINLPDTASHNICIFSLGHASQSRKVMKDTMETIRQVCSQ